MTTATPTSTTIFTAIRGLLLSLIDDCEVIKSLNNKTPMPVGGFIAMTMLFDTRLATNTHVYLDSTPETGIRKSKQQVQKTIQFDCYGPDSAEWAGVLSTMLRDDYSCRYLQGFGVQPIDADDPKLMPIIDGEQQYLHRWVVTAKFQVNFDVLVPQQFFDEAVVVIHPAF